LRGAKKWSISVSENRLMVATRGVLTWIPRCDRLLARVDDRFGSSREPVEPASAATIMRRAESLTANKNFGSKGLNPMHCYLNNARVSVKAPIQLFVLHAICASEKSSHLAKTDLSAHFLLVFEACDRSPGTRSSSCASGEVAESGAAGFGDRLRRERAGRSGGMWYVKVVMQFNHPSSASAVGRSGSGLLSSGVVVDSMAHLSRPRQS
jgi:hypothetical protein